MTPTPRDEADIEVAPHLAWHKRGCVKRYGAESDSPCECDTPPDEGMKPLSVDETQQALGAEKPITVSSVHEAAKIFRNRHKATNYGGTDLSKHPALLEAYRIACLIEACGASPDLTTASCAAFDFIKTLASDFDALLRERDQLKAELTRDQCERRKVEAERGRLLQERGEMVKALKLARKHLDTWVGAMHQDIDCNDDVDALEKIDAALSAAGEGPST